MPTLRLYAVLGSMLAALGVLACPGGVDSSQGDGGGEPVPVTFGSSGCGLCIEDRCAEQVEGCGTDPGCAAHLECLLDCPLGEDGNVDASCAEACPSPPPGIGLNAKQALEACRTTGPGGACTPCGGTPLSHPILDQTCNPSTLPDACEQCEAEKCCQTLCDGACNSYVTCMQSCNDQTCRDACAAQWPAGVQSFGKWIGCSMPNCRDVCQRLIIGPCLECGIAKCPVQWADCMGNADCYQRFLCGTFCPDFDEACYLACDVQYPAADAFFGALLLCIGDSCLGTACEGGPEL